MVAVVSDKHLDLRVQTEYIGVKKEKTLATPEGELAPKYTPEANSGTGFSNPIITEQSDLSSENAKKVEKASTSRKSIDVDKAYLEAVEKNDTATMEKMVAQAAKNMITYK